jgi:hypothetical protein
LTQSSSGVFDIGSDTGAPVDDRDFHVPSNFTAKLAKLPPADEKRLM